MMPVYVPDLTTDTQDLSAEQFGCYMRILFFMWQKKGEPIVDGDDRMARLCDVPRAKWLKIRPTLAPFFDSDDLAEGRWSQSRLRREWESADAKAEKARQNGKKGGRRSAETETQRVSAGLARTDESEGGAQEPAGLTRYRYNHRYPQTENPEPLQSVTAALAIVDPSGRWKKIRDGGGGSDSGRWGDQRSRDEYAVQACLPHLPGRDDGERWAVAMAAEDPADPGHAGAVRAMREAAKAAGVGWVSPERRRGAA